jgi:hypothetical protein
MGGFHHGGFFGPGFGGFGFFPFFADFRGGVTCLIDTQL